MGMADRGIGRDMRHMDTGIPARVPALPMPDRVLAVIAAADAPLAGDLAAIMAVVDAPVAEDVQAAGITATKKFAVVQKGHCA
jgi:hypothetical protein